MKRFFSVINDFFDEYRENKLKRMEKNRQYKERLLSNLELDAKIQRQKTYISNLSDQKRKNQERKIQNLFSGNVRKRSKNKDNMDFFSNKGEIKI